MLKKKLKKNKNKKSIKGFTLIELVVTLSIAAVILVMIGVFSSSIASITAKNRYELGCITEYQDAKTKIETFIDTYSIPAIAYLMCSPMRLAQKLLSRTSVGIMFLNTARKQTLCLLI